MIRDSGQSNELLNAVAATVSPSSQVKRYFTVPELMRLTCATRKQITYWAKIQLLVPTIRYPDANIGQPASFYSINDAVKCLIICELRKSGFSPKQVQQVAQNLATRNMRLDNSSGYLLTDGYSVYYAEDNNAVVDILKHHRQMLLLVPIQEQVAKIQEAA